MSERYYISESAERLAEGKATLSGAEAIHLIRVMRTKIGDEILLFDGRGLEYLARVIRLGRTEVEFEILKSRPKENEPEIELTMAVALPKGDRQKWLLEKLTELGVRRFIPLTAERQDVKIDENVLLRLRRQVVEATKQCGRLRLMEVCPEMTRRQAAAQYGPSALSAENSRSLALLAHPIADGLFGQLSFVDFLKRFADSKIGYPKKILIVIGPVGGFTDSEVQEAADDGWPILDLGRQVYRVETAAIVAAGLFLHLGN